VGGSTSGSGNSSIASSCATSAVVSDDDDEAADDAYSHSFPALTLPLPLLSHDASRTDAAVDDTAAAAAAATATAAAAASSSPPAGVSAAHNAATTAAALSLLEVQRNLAKALSSARHWTDVESSSEPKARVKLSSEFKTAEQAMSEKRKRTEKRVKDLRRRRRKLHAQLRAIAEYCDAAVAAGRAAARNGRTPSDGAPELATLMQVRVCLFLFVYFVAITYVFVLTHLLPFLHSLHSSIFAMLRFYCPPTMAIVSLFPLA
jgi:hypothetical protein